MNKIIKITGLVQAVVGGSNHLVDCNGKALETIVGEVIAGRFDLPNGGREKFVGAIKINLDLTPTGVSVE